MSHTSITDNDVNDLNKIKTIPKNMAVKKLEKLSEF